MPHEPTLQSNSHTTRMDGMCPVCQRIHVARVGFHMLTGGESAASTDRASAARPINKKGYVILYRCCDSEVFRIWMENKYWPRHIDTRRWVNDKIRLILARTVFHIMSMMVRVNWSGNWSFQPKSLIECSSKSGIGRHCLAREHDAHTTPVLMYTYYNRPLA